MLKESVESRPVVTAAAALSLVGAIVLGTVLFAFPSIGTAMFDPETIRQAKVVFAICIIVCPAAFMFLSLLRWAKGEPKRPLGIVHERLELASDGELRVLLAFNGERRAKIAASMTTRTLRGEGLISLKSTWERRGKPCEYAMAEDVFRLIERFRSQYEDRLKKG